MSDKIQIDVLPDNVNEVKLECITCKKIVYYGSKEMDQHKLECKWVGYVLANV